MTDQAAPKVAPPVLTPRDQELMVLALRCLESGEIKVSYKIRSLTRVLPVALLLPFMHDHVSWSLRFGPLERFEDCLMFVLFLSAAEMHIYHLACFDQDEHSASLSRPCITGLTKSLTDRLCEICNRGRFQGQERS
jgi:hypothetical protein